MIFCAYFHAYFISMRILDIFVISKNFSHWVLLSGHWTFEFGLSNLHSIITTGLSCTWNWITWAFVELLHQTIKSVFSLIQLFIGTELFKHWKWPNTLFRQRIEKWVMEFFNLLLKYFRELDSLYIIGTCLVIVIISICFLLVAGILIPNSDLKSKINAIFLQDT